MIVGFTGTRNGMMSDLARAVVDELERRAEERRAALFPRCSVEQDGARCLRALDHEGECFPDPTE